MGRRDDIEIMAPVGSYESLMAAINAGANSIYFGVEKLNMRSRSAANFTIEDLHKICSICEEHGVKSYLTINTVIFDEEFAAIDAIAEAAKAAKISAIIASDIGVISLCRSKDINVHISTQLNITNYHAVKFYSQFADVVVLAREMDLDRVAKIHREIIKNDLRGPSGDLIKIEMFVHGALCMAVSGKCYLSLHEKQMSANRGACMQKCRRSYIVTDKESGDQLEIDNQYIMSPKDLKTIHFLNKLLDAGVSILKIEGRARSPEYVKRVVETYKDGVDSYFGGSFSEEKILEWDNNLKEVFNRGFWNGYYLGEKLGEWSHTYGSEATTRKVYSSKVTNFFSKIGVAELKLESGSIAIGDKFIITGPTTGVVEGVIEEIRVDLKNVNSVEKGELFSIKLDKKIRRADKLYKIIDII